MEAATINRLLVADRQRCTFSIAFLFFALTACLIQLPIAPQAYAALDEDSLSNEPTNTRYSAGLFAQDAGLIAQGDRSSVVESGTCGDALNWTLDDTGLLVITGEGAMSDMSSASKAPWYSKRADIVSVSIGEGVTTVGKNAFNGYAALKQIAIPASVVEIGNSAFYNCSSLESIEVADDSWLTTFGTNAFGKGPSLRVVKTTSKDVYAYFKASAALQPMPVDAASGFIYAYGAGGNGVWLLGLSTTQSWPKVPITIAGKPVIGIAEYAFADDTAIRDVVFEEETADDNGNGVIDKSQIETIEPYAFSKCTSLMQCVLPASVKTIGEYAFDNCKMLASSPFVVDTKIESIGYRAFRDCTSLPSFTMSGDVDNSIKAADIAAEAFSGCTSAKRIDLAPSVTAIGKKAFNGVDTVAFPKGSSVVTITQDMFSGCVHVILGEGTTAIGDNGFKSCSKLESVVIPKTVTSVGANAFSGCSKLGQLELTEAVTSIGAGAFKGCSLFTTFTIPSKVDALNDEVFSGCKNLTDIAVPAAVTLLGAKAFYGCSSLGSINFADDSKAVSIGDSAFEGCSALNAFNVPATVLLIGSKAFKGCTTLATFSFGRNSSLMGIGGEAFFNCKALEYIELPKNITVIDKDAFKNCASLNAVRVLFTDARLGEECFKGIANPSVISVGNETMFSQLVGNMNFIEEYTAVEYVGGNMYYIGAAKIDVSSYIDAAGKTQMSVTVVFDGTKLKEGKDYELYFEDAAQSEARTAVVKGIGKYVGYARANYRTTQDVPQAKTGLVYNGVEQTGVAASDFYTVKNGSATKAGTYTATLTLVDKYHYEWSDHTTNDKKVEWSIEQAQVVVTPATASKVYGDKDPVFTANVTSKQVLPDTANVKYRLTRTRGENVGSYIIEATGAESQGNYKVEFKTGSFSITKRSFSDAVLTLSETSFPYTGSAIRPVAKVTFNGATLKEKTDYVLSYSNNVDIGTATVVVSGRGNFAGAAKTTFKIVSSGKGLPIGTIAKKGGAKYKVISNTKVRYVKAPSGKKKVTIPNSVKFNGKRYKVTGIGTKAFKSRPTTYVIVKATSLAKKSVKKCFKSTKVKKVKVPASKKAKYKKIFTKANCGKKVKVV